MKEEVSILLAEAEPYNVHLGTAGVLLCHGFTSTPQSLRGWANYLAGQGFSVSLPLLPGHGTRWQDLDKTTWYDWYAEVDQALDRLRTTCHTVFVGGLSMGGTLALRLAEQRPKDVQGLVLVNPSLATRRRMAPLLPILRWILPSGPNIGDDIKNPDAHEVAYERMPLHAMHQVTLLWKATRRDLPRVQAPVLLYRSQVDHVVEPLSSHILRSGLAHTRLVEHELTNSYHVATLDNDASAIFTGSAAWMRALLPPEAELLKPEDAGNASESEPGQ